MCMGMTRLLPKGVGLTWSRSRTGGVPHRLVPQSQILDSSLIISQTKSIPHIGEALFIGSGQ